ncbi:hypothetical protein K788_00010195 (plasmid) [Paraburkholderia caribensis MBA4]|uniref:Lysozyme inhibitor LprI N-terminal domain-containing protein n=1 Tax=Paraburkholderia caribensis MBA4 TaxID=1323664 RepID=A0A0P0RQD6_9BURK|nr:hypothetical protein [Paraburkholderia caribensis]ALL71249.1 hypothetical protein K788_00010195 [Paraburkholderia caribensis MBA4]
MHVTKRFTAAIILFAVQTAQAKAPPDVSSCLRHIGGGGFGDFDCYEANAKRLETDNQKVAFAIKKTDGLSVENRAKVDNYMRTQDDAVKACDMAVEFSYAWKVDTPPKTHRNLYDVMGARCHYSIRKQQNDFLRDLYSIETD